MPAQCAFTKSPCVPLNILIDAKTNCVLTEASGAVGCSQVRVALPGFPVGLRFVLSSLFAVDPPCLVFTSHNAFGQNTHCYCMFCIFISFRPDLASCCSPH